MNFPFNTKIIYYYIMENKQDLIYFKPLHLHQDFKSKIAPLLQEISQKKYSNQELLQILQQLHQQYSLGGQSKNYQQTKYKYSFKSLQKNYMQQLSLFMKQLATFLLKYQPEQPIPIIRTNCKQKQIYSRYSIFYLITLMFFGIVPYQWTNRPENCKRINNMNSFGHILSQNNFKTTCLIEYFKKTVKELGQPKLFDHVYIIYRNSCKYSIDKLIKSIEKQPLARMTIQSDNASIEDFNGSLKVDFANRFIGGGCLRNGCVQQQIMFATRPELMAVTLLCEKMQAHEALAFSGFKRYFNYTGYADKTNYAGWCKDEYVFQGNQTRKYYGQHIVAIDAIKFRKDDPSQFEKQFIDRQIEKAYAGFSIYEEDKKIITGGWGCGVYNGDFVTKLIIQWIAATLARKQIVVCPFGRKKKLMNSNFFDILGKLTIGGLYQVLIQGGKMKIKENSRESILTFIRYLLK